MTSLHARYGWASAIIVGIALVWGFAIAGSPGTERLRKFDERRIEDLRLIQREIQAAVTNATPPTGMLTMKRELPKTLQEASEIALYQKLSIVDPETSEAYGYTVRGTSSYELCATFSFARDEPYDIGWNHPAGAACFQFDVLKTEQNPVREIPVPLEVR